MLRNVFLVLCALVFVGCVASLAEEGKDLTSSTAQKEYQQGLVYDSLGQISNATSAYRRAVGLDPTFAKAWYKLGLDLYAVADKFNTYDQALQCFEKAAELDPTLDVWDVGNREPPMKVNSKEDWEFWKILHAL